MLPNLPQETPAKCVSRLRYDPDPSSNAPYGDCAAMYSSAGVVSNAHLRRNGGDVQVPYQVGKLGHVIIYDLLQGHQLLVYVGGEVVKDLVRLLRGRKVGVGDSGGEFRQFPVEPHRRSNRSRAPR